MTNDEPAGRAPGPKGTILRASGKDGPQIIHSSGKRWTDEAEEVFLDHLAASCNVTQAARRAGFSREGIYRRRRRDPGFAARWQAALAQGYARIEVLLVRSAEDFLAGRAPDPDSPLAAMTVRDAIAILKLHKASVMGGEGKRPGWPARPRSFEEVKDSILTKLAAIERFRGAA